MVVLTVENNNNQKLVIFTVYRDTAEYLFTQLKARGFTKIGFVSGTGSKTTDNDEEHKNFEPILERFAPFTKLFRTAQSAKNHVYQSYDLIYINQNGKPVLLNQKEVLEALTLHKEEARFIPVAIDRGEEKAIENPAASIQTWLKNQAIEEEKQEDGTIRKKMGAAAKDLLSKIKTGDKDALKRMSQNVKVTDKFQADNFDLITWFLVTV